MFFSLQYARRARLCSSCWVTVCRLKWALYRSIELRLAFLGSTTLFFYFFFRLAGWSIEGKGAPKSGLLVAPWMTPAASSLFTFLVEDIFAIYCDIFLVSFWNSRAARSCPLLLGGQTEPGAENFACGANCPYQALKGGYFVFVLCCQTSQASPGVQLSYLEFSPSCLVSFRLVFPFLRLRSGGLDRGA